LHLITFNDTHRLCHTPLEEIVPSQRLLPDNTQRQTSMPPAEFRPAVLAHERPQVIALDRTATGIGCKH